MSNDAMRAALRRIRDFIDDDANAITYQSLKQYRESVLQQIDFALRKAAPKEQK